MASLDEFLDAYDMPRVEQNLSGLGGLNDESSLDFEESKQFSQAENGTTEVGGKTAYFTTSRYEMLMQSFDGPLEAGQSTVYYVDLGDSGVIIYVTAMTRRGYFDQLDSLWAQTDGLYRTMRFDWGDGSTAGGSTEAPLPWKTVTGGALAVAAAAAAMAGSLASASAKGQKIDPNKPIGYILDLSTPRIQLASQQAATLEVRVHRVLASGQIELVAGAPVTLAAPCRRAGLARERGGAARRAGVAGRRARRPAHALTVAASAGGGGTQARVELVPESTSELTLSVVPAGATLKPTGRDAVMVSAELKPSALASADPNVDLTAAKKSIAFSQPTSAEWLDVGKPTDTPAGKEMPVSLSSPDPNRQLTPPESITVSATATLGAKQLSASVTIGVEKPPVIDIRPDVFECAADSKASVDVFAWIENHGNLEWTFTAKWKDGDRPLARFEITPQTPSTATVAVTEDAAKLPDTGFAKEASTLVITGSADGWDPLERYLKVIVAREGLFIDSIGRDPGGRHVPRAGRRQGRADRHRLQGLRPRCRRRDPARRQPRELARVLAHRRARLPLPPRRRGLGAFHRLLRHPRDRTALGHLEGERQEPDPR